MTINFEIFRDNLRILRLSKNLTEKELAQKIGFRPLSKIIRLENGSNNPDLEIIYSIAKYFKTPIDDLLNKKVVMSLDWEYVKEPKLDTD